MQDFDYTGPFAYHIVLTTTHRNPVFQNLDFGTQCAAFLTEAAAATTFRLLAFCFMPDHLHVLAQGENGSSNLLRLVQRFKQRSAFHFKQITGETLWQQSFFDHALRKDADLEQAATYIFANPYSAGLTQEPFAYVLSGGEFYRDILSDGAKETVSEL